VKESRAASEQAQELVQEQERKSKIKKETREQKEKNKRGRDNISVRVQCPPHVGWSIHDGFGEGNEGLHG
jgi:hypothetical protein